MSPRRGASRRTAASAGLDATLFPPSFLRLLGAVPAAVARIRAGSAEGRRAAPGEGGRFLFRGHREYRPGDDPRRVDWKVAARLDRYVVRQYDAEKDLLAEVWLDASASMAPFGGRVRTARAAALGVAIGLATGGRTRLGVLREGRPRVLLEGGQQGQLVAFLRAIGSERPSGSADLAGSLARLVRRVPKDARLLLVSDLLTRAEPGVLHTLAGRGLRGALLHLRVPEVTAPDPVGTITLRDVERETVRTVQLDGAMAARIAARAKAHGTRWAKYAAAIGLHYLPFAPATPDETLLRRMVETVS